MIDEVLAKDKWLAALRDEKRSVMRISTWLTGIHAFFRSGEEVNKINHIRGFGERQDRFHAPFPQAHN